MWVAQIVSEMGDWFWVVAIYTLLMQLTGRASSVGMALVLQTLPQTFMGPAAGVISDRLSRKKVMIFADIARACVVLAMLLVRSADMVWLAYVVMGIETALSSLFEPARSAVLPNIVSGEELLAANTLASTTWSFSELVGAALGGGAVLLIGRNAVLVVNALSFLLSAWLIWGMHFHEPHTVGRGRLQWRELVDFSPVIDGIRFIRGDARLSAMVLLKGGVGLMGASWVLYPVYGQRVFKNAVGVADPARALVVVTSVLIAVRGVGSLIGPLLSTAWVGANERRMRVVVTMGFIALSVGYLVFAGAPTLLVACLGVVVAHAGSASVWVNSSTLLQLNTEDRFRGRVFAADLGICMVSLSALAYLAGRLVDAGVGPRWIALGTSVLMLVPVAVWVRAQRLWAAEASIKNRAGSSGTDR